MTASIYQLICAHLTDGGLDDTFELPNESPDPSGIRFAPGAMDGITVYHMGHSELRKDQIKGMAEALSAASANDYEEADRLFAAWTKEVRAVSAVDDLQQYVIDHAGELNPNHIYSVASNLILGSAHIECVKIGLVLLELFKSLDDILKEPIRRLGLCDEFTLFAVWDMLKWENGNEEIFNLAQKTRSWGRIHAVERLEPATEEIRRWLLFEGVDNNVLSAYSALPCWEKSGAEQILFGEPTAEEYKALGALIEGLLDEGPVAGISLFDDPAAILKRYLSLSENYPQTDEGDKTVLAVKEWLEKNGDGTGTSPA